MSTPSPPFIWDTFDSAFWLTLSASILGFGGLCLQAILKSRCKECSCLGFKCIRDVAPPGMEPSIDLSGMEQGRPRAPSNTPPQQITIDTPE